MIVLENKSNAIREIVTGFFMCINRRDSEVIVNQIIPSIPMDNAPYFLESVLI